MTEPLLEVLNLRKSLELRWPRLFGARHVSKKAPVLSDVSFEIRKGESYGIVGLPGSGKSLLVSMILRKSAPNAGKILFEGKDISVVDPETLGQSIGTMLFGQNMMPPSRAELNSAHRLFVIGENFAQLPEKDQLETLKNLRRNRDRSLLFVQENLRMTSYAYKRVALIYRGKIVEKNAKMHGDKEIWKLNHPFSQDLLYYNKENKWPVADPTMMDPFEEIPGCEYHPVCPLAMYICKERKPPFVDWDKSRGIGVACHAANPEIS
ncbi:ABC transporter ATP-binding protein [Candidatus Bathyarchaeota archaeon]|nr:ABC transporter ATP-binding protein [Candidatus Bathyarchaeota archaeon]